MTAWEQDGVRSAGAGKIVSLPPLSCAVGTRPEGRPDPEQSVALGHPQSDRSAKAAWAAEMPGGAATPADQQPTPDSAYASRQSLHVTVSTWG